MKASVKAASEATQEGHRRGRKDFGKGVGDAVVGMGVGAFWDPFAWVGWRGVEKAVL